MLFDPGTQHRGQRRKVLITVALTTVVAVIVVLTHTDTSQWDYAFDFRLMWLAGSTWLQGFSPYTPAFDAVYAVGFGGGQASWHVFNYPPYFCLISLPLGALPYTTSVTLWLLLNVASITLAAAVIAFGVLKDRSDYRTLVFIGTVAFAITHYAGGYSLFYGQTSLLVLLGATLFVWGYSDKLALPLSVGIVLLSFKPNVGLLSGLLVLASVYDWRARQWQRWALIPVLVSSVFVLAGSLVAISIGGLDATVWGFAERIKSYSATEPSAVYSLTGLPYLLNTAGGISVSLAVSLALGAACCLYAVRNTSDRIFAACSVVAASLFFVPLHTYDLIATVALVPLLWCLSARRAVLVALGLIVIHRCNLLVLELNPRSWHDDGLVAGTFGVLVLLLACLQWRRHGPEEQRLVQ